ncbi:MAG: protein arginine kinase [Methylocystaceae bacterium]
MSESIMNNQSLQWMDGSGPEPEVVVSSRVRLARNLRRLPFPHHISMEQGQKVVAEAKAVLGQSGMSVLGDLNYLGMADLDTVKRHLLMEKHLISPEMANYEDSYRGVLTNSKGSVAIMLNEEDHVRIQVLLPGLQLNQAYKYAEVIDDELEKELDYAFDERRGYLTSCPTNVGTGMRASVMLHLPAMAMTNQAGAMFENLNQFGLTVRGVYGENSQVQGNLYQISNQVTLGQTEEDTINNLWGITMQIVEQEKKLRLQLMDNDHQLKLEDKIMRSYGILTNARLLSSQEALELLSAVRLGADLGLIKDINTTVLNELMVAIRPAHLQMGAGREMEPQDRDALRAKVVNERLKEVR